MRMYGYLDTRLNDTPLCNKCLCADLCVYKVHYEIISI
jgi:hypothetical protein